jgi:hypothetical protein
MGYTRVKRQAFRDAAHYRKALPSFELPSSSLPTPLYLFITNSTSIQDVYLALTSFGPRDII